MGREPGRIHRETTLDSALKDELKLDADRRKGCYVRKDSDEGTKRVCDNIEDRGPKDCFGNNCWT